MGVVGDDVWRSNAVLYEYLRQLWNDSLEVVVTLQKGIPHLVACECILNAGIVSNVSYIS
jgi:hypothetical protein